MVFTKRSATLVVAVEQLCGNTAEGTTLFSAYWKESRRREPAFRGMSLSRLLKMAPTTALVAAALETGRWWKQLRAPQLAPEILDRRGLVQLTIAADCITRRAGSTSSSCGPQSARACAPNDKRQFAKDLDS
jgi:hypothetical protein